MAYLTNERNLKLEAATKIISPTKNHADIRAEFETWIQTRSFENENPVTVEGYTAAMISEIAPFMSGVGVFNFLVTLRERPDEAKQYIDEDFPVI